MERKVIRLVLAAVTFVAAAVLCAPAYADDYGPHPDLRAIYHDLPLIHRGESMTMVLEAVAVSGNGAVAQAKIDGADVVDILVRRYDRWWLESTIVQSSHLFLDGAHCGIDLTPNFLEENGVARDLAEIAPHHLSLVRALPTIAPTPKTGDLVKAGCDVETYDLVRLFFNADRAKFNIIASQGYTLRATFALNDSPSDGFLDEVWLRRPTEAESWVTRGGNSYAFFSADVKSTQPVHVQSGTTIDVHFPFALPPEKKYSLTIGYTDEPIGPIDGTLKDNTLHFVLPVFSVKPGAHLMGEIDGNPPGL